MDDVLLCVPTVMAVALMAKFKANLVPLHLEEVPKKGQWYIKNHELADFHENAGTFLPRTRGVAETKDKDGNPIKGYGVEVAGVPMGDRGYILAVLTQKVAIASSTQILISNLLRFADPLSVPDHQAVPRSPVRVLGQARVPQHLRRVREDHR
jgi:hypothetical protein